MNSEPGFFSASAIGSQPSRPSAFREAVLASFSAMGRGRLQVDLPGGASAQFGAGPGELPLGIAGSARMRVHREAFFRKCVLSGDIGFAESYIDGDWTSPDLVAVVSWFLLNVEDAPTVSGSRRARSAALNLLRVVNRIGHAMRPNSRARAARNIRDHYDLSNDFFTLFLDPTMMYSSARWATPGLTLEEAQVGKNERLCQGLRLSPDDHVLEIGTGWGGWALHAAQRHRCRVTTLTLSERQFEYASRRVAQAGLSDRVTVKLQDFREVSGVYDKIVSIEMVEALGHRYVPEFCRVVGRSLRRDGLLAMQFITCPDARYEEFRRGVDFIQKHIFPGSLLLSLNRFNDLLSNEAGMILHQAEDMGRDYALTLRRWAESFGARTAEVHALGFDDRFVRKWAYYLAYCEAAFAMRNISVVQTVHTRPNNLSL
jgi:cyclopropane-fatty-acyl-phospholipid synthase